MELETTLGLQILAAGFKGRKPGKKNIRSAHKLLDQAKKYWTTGDGSFQLELQRECDAEDPRKKMRIFADLTKTQRMSVAKRMYSKAISRYRASRQK